MLGWKRNCIPSSVRLMGPSFIYVGTSHRVFTGSGEQEGEMEKQLLFFFFQYTPMLPIMCQTNKSGKIEAHGPTMHHHRQLGSRVSECESQTFGLAPCRHPRNHLSVLNLSLGQYRSYSESELLLSHTHMRFVCLKMYVQCNNSASLRELDTTLKHLIKTKSWCVAALHNFCF